MLRKPLLAILLPVLFLCIAGPTCLHATLPAELSTKFLPIAEILCGADDSFQTTLTITFPVSESTQQITARLNRDGDEDFELQLDHTDYAVEIRRNRDAIAFILPKHNVVYLGVGPLQGADSLAPKDFLKRICSSGTKVAQFQPVLAATPPAAVLPLICSLSPPEIQKGMQYKFGKSLYVDAGADDEPLKFKSKSTTVAVSTGPSQPMRSLDNFQSMRVVRLDRTELESQLARGCRRALELLSPSSELLEPSQVERKVPHGELRWIDGQRIVLLSGTPEEMGTAHGQLLKEEAQRCIDSVLNLFGTVETVRSGKWFPHELQAAAKRLLPHIPERHREETRALAASLNLDPKLMEQLNVFPELFHCSGFAVFGEATRDGKLYHGRVLDYMTMIGLQDAAVTFIVAPEGMNPFVNVGYAGFIGSVSGMNQAGISLGEMGGHGEGDWDGVPMATLMRRALEECSTLEEVKDLWRNNPRTCEYYYVFADGKTRDAVGVIARPDYLEFLGPGEAHPRLGEGIKDAVVLSAGNRLKALRSRVQEHYGQIDAEIAQGLMCQPVAMKSNLHDVLFVPEDGILYVAQADHKHPAADLPYVKINFRELLKEMESSQ